MGLGDTKPGVLGTIGGLGQQAVTSVTKAAKDQVIRTMENSAEQLGMKERREGAPPSVEDPAVQAEAAKKQSADVTNWLYGPSEATPTAPPPPDKPVEARIADLKKQLLGITKDAPVTTMNAAEQLNVLPQSSAPADQQGQKSSNLHQEYAQPIVGADYHQKLRSSASVTASDTDERKEDEQKKREREDERMARMKEEDERKKREEEEKKKPVPGTEPNIERNRGSSG